MFHPFSSMAKSVCERRFTQNSAASRSFSDSKASETTHTSHIVKGIYRNFLILGRDYPDGLAHVRERTKRAFMRNKNETDPEKIMNGIKRAQFVLKEMEALIQLKKYRAMKRRYVDNKDRNPLDLKTFEDSIVDL